MQLCSLKMGGSNEFHLNLQLVSFLQKQGDSGMEAHKRQT
jgi:hypothetical protein